MLSTWKYSVLALLLTSSTLFAATEAQIKDFLNKSIGANPNIVKFDISVVAKQKLSEPAGWEAYVIKLDGDAKIRGNVQHIVQNIIYFAYGDFITTELINVKTGAHMKDSISPEFKDEFYKKSNLISGSKNSKHKVAIFSDPLCPFCRKIVPAAIEYMTKYPNDFALYYYHLPLASLHPAAVTLTKAAVAAELHDVKDVVKKLYNVSIKPEESDKQKILDAFNKTLKTKITIADIEKKDVQDHSASDSDIAANLMVNGTPTIFFDGKKDSSKKKYLDVKVTK
jgi:thiol-disulfide isomerase/thioredoxin